MIPRIVLALVTALVWGCSATPRAAESSPGHTGHPTAQWRRVHGVISPEIDRLLTAGGITILSVWYDNAELLAVLDISMATRLQKAQVMDVYSSMPVSFPRAMVTTTKPNICSDEQTINDICCFRPNADNLQRKLPRCKRSTPS